jgi:hypothetical protein
MAIFGASVQVIALIVAIVCLISAILGRSFGIGPVQIPAPRELLPRASLAALGLSLLIVAFWSNIAGKPLFEIIIERISPPENPQFDSDNRAFTDLLAKPGVSVVVVRLRAETLYDEAPTGAKRCLVVREITDVIHGDVDAYPLKALADAAKYAKNSLGSRDMVQCGHELIEIATLSMSVKKQVVAVAPMIRPTAAASGRQVVSRPTPSIETNGTVSQDTARRVLTAQTLPGDVGWIFIGIRNLEEPMLIADRRIEGPDIPRSGIVATIADTELLETTDPARSLGMVRGYVDAGSAVEVLRISGPRHYTNGVWDGYDVYANVRIKSLPKKTVASSGQPAPESPSSSSAASGSPASPGPIPNSSENPSASTAVAACAALPSSSTTFFTYCNETYPLRFGEYTFRSYKVTDSHSTGIHFRNIGPRAVYLSIFPSCEPTVRCPKVQNALLPPVTSMEDASNDYIYNAETVEPLNYGWTIDVSPPQQAQST